MQGFKGFILGLSLTALILVSFFGGALADRVFVIKPLDYLVDQTNLDLSRTNSQAPSQPLVLGDTDAYWVAAIAEQASRSVITVSIQQVQQTNPLNDPFYRFFGVPAQPEQQPEEIQQDIGTGFVVGDGGLVVTNKHVVSNPNAEYLVFDSDNNEHRVTNIYRDPSNDLAILEVEGLDAPSLPLGDSDQLRVGEPVVAIGTALGEFRDTVTSGVISGLGRGITAGDPYGMSRESLENVLQTDAAINPGNSGGPLINAAGQVIGVNVAVSQNAQNIGFAIPINVVKASIQNFEETGEFDRPFMGIQYRMITEQAALLNEVPQGAYLVQVVEDSAAAEAGLETGDIITRFDGEPVRDTDLVALINQHKIGDRVEVEYFRAGQTQTTTVTLQKAQVSPAQ